MDGEHRPLPELFFVIATQNPVEFRGTYPLPEAQMDRFAMQFALGYVQPEEEVAILTDAGSTSIRWTQLQAVRTLAEVLALKRAVQAGAHQRGAQALRGGSGRGHPHGRRRAVGRQPARLAGPDEGRPGAGAVRRAGICDARSKSRNWLSR